MLPQYVQEPTPAVLKLRYDSGYNIVLDAHSPLRETPLTGAVVGAVVEGNTSRGGVQHNVVVI